MKGHEVQLLIRIITLLYMIRSNNKKIADKLSVTLHELLHREWLSMPWIDGVDNEIPQFFDTCIRCLRVVHNGIEDRFINVVE